MTEISTYNRTRKVSVTRELNVLGVDRGWTLRGLHHALQKELEAVGMFCRLDYFDIGCDLRADVDKALSTFLSYRWIAVWTAPGDNEGDYVHVDLVGHAPSTVPGVDGHVSVCRNVILGKTFEGPEFACDVVKAITLLVGE